MRSRFGKVVLGIFFSCFFIVGVLVGSTIVVNAANTSEKQGRECTISFAEYYEKKLCDVYYSTEEYKEDGLEYLFFQDFAVVKSYEGTKATVTIPSTIKGHEVKGIQMQAFMYSTVEKVTIPESVVCIGQEAFYGCEKVTSMELPKTVTYLGTSIFANDTNLAKLTIAKENPAYISSNNIIYTRDKKTLYACASKVKGKVTIPNTVTTIAPYAFFGCREVTKVVIPSSVRKISEFAFYYCESLTDISLPEGVATIGNSAFSTESYRITSLYIPSSVTKLEGNIVTRNYGLESITVSSKNPVYSSKDGVVYNKNKTVLYIVPNGISGEFTIPSSVKTLEEESFFCSHITKLNIPYGVQTIGDVTFQFSSIQSINIPTSVKKIGDNAIGNCHGLKSVTVPTSVTQMGWNVFGSCSGFTMPVIYCAKNSYTHKYVLEQKEIFKEFEGDPSCVYKYKFVSKECADGMYTLKLDGNGGSLPKAWRKGQSITVGKRYPALPTGKRKGYTFAGWYTKKSGGSKIISSSWNFTAGNRTLYARWSKVKVERTKVVKAVNSGKRRLSVSWKKVKGAAGYEVLYSTDGKFKKKAAKSTKNTYLTVTGLKKGKTYYCKVHTYKLDSAGYKVYSGYSNVKKVRICK